MTAIGKTTKLMVMEYTVIWMALGTKDTGRRISNTEKDLKHGLMVLAIEETMLRVRSTEQAVSPGLMEAPILGNSSRII